MHEKMLNFQELHSAHMHHFRSILREEINLKTYTEARDGEHFFSSHNVIFVWIMLSDMDFT